jgi:hypothetical protein
MRVAVMLVGLAMMPVSLASAEPMVTSFDTLNHEAETIVIGTLAGSSPDADGNDVVVDHPRSFTVETVVRGKSMRGQTITVKQSSNGHFGNSKPERMIGFIDKNQSLQWAGHLLAGKTLETGVILISGYYDFNAHLVSPGTMTLVQLKSLLADKPINQNIVVTLAFPNGHGGMSASKQDFAIEFEPKTNKTTLLRSSVRCLKTATLSAADWGNTFLSLELEISCGKETRSVSLFGKFVSVDAQGTIRITATPGTPVMTAADFQSFLSDPTIKGFQRIVNVDVAGERWQWNVTEQSIDGPKGVRGVQSTGPGSSRSPDGVETESFVFDQSGIVLTLVHRDPSAGTAMGLMQLIESARTECRIAIGGKPVRRCTLRQIAPLVVTEP